MYGPQAGGDVRPVPVQYGLRRAGALAVADGLSSGAAGVEQTRSRLPVLRASVRSPLYGGNGSPAIPVRLAKLDRSQDARLSIIRKGGPEFDTVLSLSGRAAATEPHTRCSFDATRPFPLSAATRTVICRQKRKHHSHVAADTPPVRAAVSDSFRPSSCCFRALSNVSATGDSCHCALQPGALRTLLSELLPFDFVSQSFI
jgi:hypothetical protein